MVRVDGSGSANSLIKIRGLDKKYKRGGEEIDVLQGLNLDVDQGEFVAFMGPSGSGKTTLLNLLGGLDVPSHGSITVAGDEITHMSSGKLTQWRARHVGFIFQMYNLIPVLTAFQNVELPLLLTKLSKSERRKHVETALGVVGLADRMNHYPRQLSGGQEQRVAIARAIVADPTFLLCDEPTGDLDRKSADEILELLQRFSKEHNKTILMVTHDPMAAERAQATLHLNKGVLVEGGAGREHGMKFLHLIFANLVAQEDAHDADRRFVRRGAVSVRIPGGGERRVRRWRGHRRRGPAVVTINRVSIIQPLPALLPRSDPAHPRREVRHAQ